MTERPQWPTGAARRRPARRRASALAVAVAAALLAAPALQRPAGAERAGDCYAELNAVRARAGVPPASPAALPALARAAANHARYRVGADLAGGGADPGRYGPDQTAHQETPGRAGFTGRMPWDRTRAAGLPDGSWRRQFEDVVTASGVGAADLRGVDSWLAAPYHRLPLLDANNLAAGCAAAGEAVGQRSRAAQVLTVAATWAPPRRRLTVWPPPGQAGVAAAFDRLVERPSPFPGAPGTLGYVVTVQADGYDRLRIRELALFRGRSPVAAHRAAGERAAGATLDPNLPANAAMLAATAPLAPRTTYRVRVAAEVGADGGRWTRLRPRSWWFTTA